MALLSVAGPIAAQQPLVLTMERALDLATEGNPDMKRAFLSMEQNRELLIAQKASLKSKFSLDLTPASYDKSRQYETFNTQWYTGENFRASGRFSITQPILWTDGTISLIDDFGWQYSSVERQGGSYVDKAFNNNLYLSLNQPLFTYNRQRMQLKQIELDYENSHIAYALRRLSMEKEITQQFYNLFLAQEQLKIGEEALRSAQANYEIIKGMVEGDLSPRSELYQAELNLAQSQSAMANYKVDLANQQDAFLKMLGLPLDQEVSVLAVINDQEKIDVDVRYAIDHAMDSRLELRQREIELEKLDQQMVVTKASDEFKGNLALSFGLMGDNEKLSRIYKNPTQNPRVELTFSVPIFDWGAKKARIKAQERAIESANLDFVEARKDIEIDILRTSRSLDNQWQQINIAKQSVRNAQFTFDLNTIRYRKGEIDGMNMRQYEDQLSSQKMDYYRTIINYKLELLNMKILTLYDFENKAQIVPITEEKRKEKLK
ncbi:MAG: TolC family protein [Rikenellaceae bacterium]|nr:TolC family protein [Rikenellaceae bacterium]